MDLSCSSRPGGSISPRAPFRASAISAAVGGLLGSNSRSATSAAVLLTIVSTLWGSTTAAIATVSLAMMTAASPEAKALMIRSVPPNGLPGDGVAVGAVLWSCSPRQA